MVKTKENKNIDQSIQTSITTNLELVKKLELEKVQNTTPEPVKKKAPTEPQKGYWSFLRLASLGVVLLLLAYFLATGIGIDLVEVVMAFFESFDPFKPFRGGNVLDPSDYVMFINK